MAKIGRNKPCPCGSGRTFKHCHGGVAQQERLQRALTASAAHPKLHQAREHQRQAQQGLGKPIISTEVAGHRIVAAGSRVYYGKAWRTFPDFLMYFLGNALGGQLGNAELAKPEAEMHPVALWHRKVCQLQAEYRQKPNEIFGTPETGATRAYLELAYDLYLLEHNAELRKILIARLRVPDQFLGALSEIRAAGMFVRAGFSIKFEDESDSRRTHCEYEARRHSSGKAFSVEVKTKHWGSFPNNDAEGHRKVRIRVGRLLRDALEKEAEHERLVFIELAMPDEAPERLSEPREPWWMQAVLDGIRETEELLRGQGKAVPAARVIVCNHPYQFHLESTRSLVGFVCQGFGPTDFRTNQLSPTIREAAQLREKHADFLALWNSVKKHRHIPQTFDGSSPHLASGDNHPPRLIVGQRYQVPNATGQQVAATLEQAVAIPSEKRIYGIYRTDPGERFICTNDMTDAEAKAYAEHPETFFGVVERAGSLTGPVDLYLWFLETYSKSSRDDLLRFMAGRPDIETLRQLSREELAEIFSEAMANGITARGNAAKTAAGPQPEKAATGGSMDGGQLIAKIERLHAAVGAAEDRDLSKIKATVTQTANSVTVQHDFRGDLTQAQIEHLAWGVIRAIADLKDHLNRWAAAHGHPRDMGDHAVQSSPELSLVVDLANFDKHGGHGRSGGISKLYPELKNLRRGLRITTAAQPGAMAGMQLLPTGEIRTVGDAAVTILGDVCLRDGRRIEIGYVQQRAIEAWEKAFTQLGVAT